MAKSQAHPVPPMTHPYGQYWKQPSRFEIEIDDTHAMMSRASFDALLDYSASQPTGAYEGKMWKAHYKRDGWCLRWFGPSDKPDMVSVNGRKILIV